MKVYSAGINIVLDRGFPYEPVWINKTQVVLMEFPLNENIGIHDNDTTFDYVDFYYNLEDEFGVPLGATYDEVIDALIQIIQYGSTQSYIRAFENYNDLITQFPIGNLNDLAYVKNSQGISWLPGTLGGTFYSKGTYIWNGAIWDSSVDEIAKALEDINTKLVTIETGAEVNINPDWNAISGDAEILNKPDLSIYVPYIGADKHVNLGNYDLSSRNLKIQTTSSSTGGIIYQNNLPFIHSYGIDNFFAGGAGNFTMTGLGRNVAIGFNAFTKATTATECFALGVSSLERNLTGSYDVAIGYLALQKSTNVRETVALGRYAFQNALTMRWGVAIGQQSGRNTQGNGNTFVGNSSGFSNTSGEYNTALGYLAGWEANAYRCVYLGANTGGTNTTNDLLFIDNTNTLNPLIWGDFANRIARINGKLQIGNYTAGNYTEFESDGTRVAKGTATTFRDELGDALNLKISGTGLSLDLNEGCIVFNTASNLLDYAFRNLQINHDWLFGSNLEPHVHAWQTNNSNPNLLLIYRWQKNGGAKTTAWTSVRMNVPVFTYVSGTLNQIWSVATPITPPAGYGISDIVQMKVIRDNNNTSGLFTGADAYTGNLLIMSFDTHLESDTDGSRTLYGK